MHPETVEPTDHSRLAWLQDELAAVRFAAHMPDDYEYGLPSWINQHLYAAYIGASIPEIVLEKIRQGRLTFPEAPSYQRMLALESENEALRAQVEKLEYELAELKHVADEPQTGEPPDELWLQWYGDDEGNYLWPDDAYRAGVTWSQFRVWRHDVRYVRADDRPEEAADDEQ